MTTSARNFYQLSTPDKLRALNTMQATLQKKYGALLPRVSNSNIYIKNGVVTSIPHYATLTTTDIAKIPTEKIATFTDYGILLHDVTSTIAQGLFGLATTKAATLTYEYTTLHYGGSTTQIRTDRDVLIKRSTDTIEQEVLLKKRYLDRDLKKKYIALLKSFTHEFKVIQGLETWKLYMHKEAKAPPLIVKGINLLKHVHEHCLKEATKLMLLNNPKWITCELTKKERMNLAIATVLAHSKPPYGNYAGVHPQVMQNFLHQAASGQLLKHKTKKELEQLYRDLNIIQYKEQEQ